MTIPVSVSAPKVARAEAGYGYRAMAALLDGLVLYTLLFLIHTGWLLTAGQPEAPLFVQKPVPPLVWVLIVLSFGIYLTVAAVLGRTLGMQAAGLRIVSAEDGARLGPLRALSRTLVLLVAAGLLVWVHPSLVVAYSLWMLFNTRRQMLHDQISGAVVIRPAALAATRRNVGVSDPWIGSLEPPQARTLLEDLDLVRRRARGDVHAESVPLFALALIAVGYAMAGWNTFSTLRFQVVGLVGPIGLLLMAGWMHRLQRRDGVGAGAGPLVGITIFVTCAGVVSGFFPIGGVLTAIGFLALAFSQHSRVIAVAAVLLGVVAGAEHPFNFISFGISNRFSDGPIYRIFSEHGSAIVFGLLALLLLGTGATYLRRERASAADHR